MSKQALIEMAKEAARIAFFGALTALLGWFSQQLAGLDPSSVYYVVGTVVLRLVDKYIHENKDIAATGISPL